MVVYGMTAANDLGLTTAVPSRIEVLVDARLEPITLGNQEISFKHAAPSRLYWAGSPAIRMGQALYWRKDVIDRSEKKRTRVYTALSAILLDPRHVRTLSKDLKAE